MSTAMEAQPGSPATPDAGRGTEPPTALTRGSTRTLVSVLELGILGDLLLRAGGIGVNLTLWCWALLAVGIMTTTDVAMDRRRVILLLAAAFFAAVPGWRSEEGLVFFSGIAVLTLLVLLTWTAGTPGMALAARTIGSYVGAARTALLHIIAGVVPLAVAQARAHADSASAYRRPAGAVVRGLILATPILLVFAALLMEADAAYASVVRSVVRWDTGAVLSHLALTAVFAWLGAAYLTASVQWTRIAPASSWQIRLGAIEAGTVLALVNALFLSFVLFQSRYLFGGVSHVLETAGLTYAEYARRGFFELVALSAIALPLLIVTTSGAKIETPRELRVQRALAGTLVGLLLLMMGSALSRMWLYQAEYGWTLDRVYATTLMLWLGGSMVWFSATALRGAPQRFMIGSIGGGLAMLAALVLVNPPAMIVRANAARVADGKDFDLQPVMRGADALPALLDVLPSVVSQLDEREQCSILAAIALPVQQDAATRGDWRTFTVSRLLARGAVQRHRARAESLLGPPARCLDRT